MNFLDTAVSLIHDLFIFTRVEQRDEFRSKKEYITYIASVYMMTIPLCIVLVLGCYNMMTSINPFNVTSFFLGLCIAPLSLFILITGYKTLNKKYKG